MGGSHSRAFDRAWPSLAAGGRNWARTAAVAWMGLIGVIFSLSAMAIVGDHLGAGWLIVVMGLLFCAAAYRLYTSPHIDAFLASRRKTTSAPLAS